MGHQETYRHNQAYADFLANWDESFYSKYADALKLPDPGSRVLDVGCGAGQVVGQLTQAGQEAYGVDVSEPNIEKARQFSDKCQFYDGVRLPFPDGHFAAVGALNVLEHVESPEAFIPELARVVQDGGRLVISSPNFFRVIGFRDYHRHMRGLGNKWRNWLRILEKRRLMKCSPDQVRFDRMQPIVREPFQPDDDAIIATNPFEMKFFMERSGCKVTHVHCTDRYVPRIIHLCLNATPLKWYLFNAFLIAQKTGH